MYVCMYIGMYVFWGGGRTEGKGERDSQADPLLSMEFNLTTLKPWPKSMSRVGCSTNWATQEPLLDKLLNNAYLWTQKTFDKYLMNEEMSALTLVDPDFYL